MLALRRVLQVGYAPAFFVFFLTAGLAIVGRGLPALWLLPLLVCAIGVSLVAERIAPYRAAWNHAEGDVGRDIAHATANEVASALSVAAMPALLSQMPGLGLWPHEWPLAVQLALAVLVTDVGVTLVHFLSHRRQWLWRLHAVHHSVTRMYGFNGLMKHPLHLALETAAGVTPLVLMGMPVHVAALLGYAVAIQLLLQHSNADYRIGPAKYVLALNEGHRVHHLKWAGIGDVNFGLFTLVWDHLMRTYSYHPTRRFDSTQLGMAAKPDYPSGYLRQMIYPFTRGGGCTLTPTTAGLDAQASDSDPGSKYRC